MVQFNAVTGRFVYFQSQLTRKHKHACGPVAHRPGAVRFNKIQSLFIKCSTDDEDTVSSLCLRLWL